MLPLCLPGLKCLLHLYFPHWHFTDFVQEFCPLRSKIEASYEPGILLGSLGSLEGRMRNQDWVFEPIDSGFMSLLATLDHHCTFPSSARFPHSCQDTHCPLLSGFFPEDPLFPLCVAAWSWPAPECARRLPTLSCYLLSPTIFLGEGPWVSVPLSHPCVHELWASELCSLCCAVL